MTTAPHTDEQIHGSAAGAPPASGPSDAVQNLLSMSDLITPMAVRAATTLRLVSHLRGGPRTIDELAQESRTKPQRLSWLLGLLSERGLFTLIEDVVEVTPLGTFLDVEPPGIGAMLCLDGLSGKYDTAAIGMVEAMRPNGNAFESVHGVDYWTDLVANDQALGLLNSMESTKATYDADLLLSSIDWEQAQSVLDVGGSNGSTLAPILVAHEHLTGGVLDLPGRSLRAPEVFQEAGVSERACVIEGSFFDALPAGYDVYLLSAVLADWDDSRAVQILRNLCLTGETVIVSEVSMFPTEAARDYQFSLRMLCGTGGVNRDSDEIDALARHAGLQRVGSVQRSTHRSVHIFRSATV